MERKRSLNGRVEASSGAPWLSPVQLAEALEPFANTAEAASLEQISPALADAEVLLRLQLAGFEGTEWETFATALVEYGTVVMRAWISTGKVFPMALRKGVKGVPILREHEDPVCRGDGRR